MKPRPFDYVRPETVDEAVAVLAEHGDGARVLAGGQSLMAMLNLRLVDVGVLVDIARIAELDAIRDLGDTIEVGAAVTQNKLMNWPQLAGKLPLLAAALPHVGHFQTRNKGTVCGSIAHADPSSEIPLSLAVLGRRGGAALAARHPRAQGRRLPARHALDRLRAGRTDHRRALSGRAHARRGVPRGGAPARRLRHHRGRGGDGGRRHHPARRRRHGGQADRAAHPGEWSSRGTQSTSSRPNSKATRTCTLRPRCGATSCATSRRS